MSVINADIEMIVIGIYTGSDRNINSVSDVVNTADNCSKATAPVILESKTREVSATMTAPSR